MKFKDIKNRKDLISIALFVLSAILGFVLIVRVGVFLVSSARAERLVHRVVDASKSDPNDSEQYFAELQETAEELKKKNLFAPLPPKKNPVNEVRGILGDMALINGKWYKVGDKIGDANVVAIEPTYVKIEWEGKEKMYSPFDVKSPERDKEKPGRIDKRERRRGRREDKKAQRQVSRAGEEDPFAWMGVKLSSALRAKLLEKWNGMSDEEKQKMKEQWNSMSEEKKQEAVDSMEENIDNI